MCQFLCFQSFVTLCTFPEIFKSLVKCSLVGGIAVAGLDKPCDVAVGRAHDLKELCPPRGLHFWEIVFVGKWPLWLLSRRTHCHHLVFSPKS